MSQRSTQSSAVSPCLPTPPSAPKIPIHTSATSSSTTVQPTLTTPGVPVPRQFINPKGRWGWVSRHPIAISFAITLSIVLLIIAVMLLILNRDVQQLYAQIPYNVTGIAIMGHNCLLDLDKRTLTIQWEISGCGDHRLSTYQSSKYFGASTTCGPFDRAVDIYLNDAAQPVFSYDPAHLPVSPTRGALYMHDILNFGIEHQMSVYAGSLYFPATKERHYFDQELIAPFDDYFLDAFVFVIDKATNESVHITRFGAADPLNNFVTFSEDTETTNEFTYDAGNGTTTVKVESRALVVTVQRSVLARAFTICMLLVNWALTIGSLYVTLAVLVRGGKSSEAVLALPVTLILTIPALRSLFVGSPPFGILLDIVGFFLQIILIALCSLALLYVVGTPSPRDEKQKHSL